MNSSHKMWFVLCMQKSIHAFYCRIESLQFYISFPFFPFIKLRRRIPYAKKKKKNINNNHRQSFFKIPSYQKFFIVKMEILFAFFTIFDDIVMHLPAPNSQTFSKPKLFYPFYFFRSVVQNFKL